MAKVGLKYPVFAPINTEERNKPIVYKPGVVFGKAISANVTWTRNSSKLFADDAEAEAENSITGGSISFTVDQVSDAGREAAFGYEVKDSDGNREYDITGDATPYGGFGYIEVMRHDGVNKYRGLWIHKIQFAMQEMAAQTKGESVAWQTEAVSGTVMAVYNDDSGKQKFVAVYESANEAAVTAWLKSKAGIA